MNLNFARASSLNPREGLSSGIMIALIVVLLLIPPLTGNSYVAHIGVLVLTFGLFSSSWNFLYGYAGQLSVGHGAFFAVGAYSGVLLLKYTSISPWFAIAAGGISAGIFGIIVGIPCVRLRGPYLAITTVAFAETLRLVVTNLGDLTGGPLGLSDYRGVWGSGDPSQFYFVVLGIAIVMTAVVWLFIHSGLGLRLKAIRDDEILAESLGIGLRKYKLIAFSSSAVIAGIAGMVYALYFLVISPLLFELELTVTIVAITVLGGLGTISGPFVGAFVYEVLVEGLRVLDAEARLIVVGVGMLLLVMLRPEGLSSAFFPSRAMRLKDGGRQARASPTDEAL